MESLIPYLPGIGLAYTVFFVGIVSPGPNVLAVMGTSMAEGRGAGLALALGVAFGSLSWALLGLAGLTALIASFAHALTIIKIAGGCYLLWLAFKAFRSAASPQEMSAKALKGVAPGAWRYGVRGFTIQMTNPKAALVWIAIISLGMQNGAPLSVGIAIVVGTFLLSVLLHAVYALVFSAKPMVAGYLRARRWIQGALGCFFAFAGFRLLTSRL